MLNYLLMFIGLIFVYQSVIFFMKLLKIKKWMAIEIELVDIKVKKEKEMALYTNLMYRYYPRILYKYTINDKIFENTTLSIDEKREWSYKENEILSKVDSIKNVNVAYVNPLKPEQSVIFNFPSKKTISHYVSILIVGLFLILAGYFLPSL